MKFLQKRILTNMINIDKVAYKEVNFKSKLIEWTQKNKVNIDFKLVEERKDCGGSPIFVYQVVLEGVEGCSGSGFSKKESQQKACKDTLTKLKREPQYIESVFAAKSKRSKTDELQEVDGVLTGIRVDDNLPPCTSSDTEGESVLTEEMLTDDASDSFTVMESEMTEKGEHEFSDAVQESEELSSKDDIITAAEQEAFKQTCKM